ncbi:MAG: phosphopentomutase [Acidobacteria bacterium]|nr:MAG: phosphopentomutase [Acidobacteriota bacterium]REK02024.1 MAG: phosphopentomutase [Acidobacteriota bacterium]REK14982.1 MAG: phosphopentomutase [Acidobacteriota bacterium]REK45696.1 MAG: phosphopentomutase [Acidobacteriota bacterium]
MNFERIILMVLDSVGVGEMPDAAEWGDSGSDTLGSVLASRKVNLPNLQRLGVGNIKKFENFEADASPIGCFGKCALKSNGKDTTTGHWEMAGIVLEKAFPTYPHGFPDDVINDFIRRTGVPGILGNKTASGTEIIKELGEEHISTGKPIVYTSADSVFQIAAHEEVIPIEKQYEICEAARGMLVGEHQVGRVIARPFIGTDPGNFTRTQNRHDYAVPPPGNNLLPMLSAAGLEVVGVGKIASIYDSVGVTKDLKAGNNEASIDQTIAALGGDSRGLIFANLVDFDMLYGHRRDVEGYAKALEDFDRRLPEIIDAMGDNDLLIITADHGNDPTYRGTDHTREYALLLAYGKRARQGVDLGTRESLADIGQTVAENFGMRLDEGDSFLDLLAE